MDAAATLALPQTAPAKDVDPATLKMRAAARKAAEDFEGVFLNTMLEGMFEGIKAEAPFGGGQTEQTYRGLLVGEYAKELSASGGLGIADQVYREILAIQEGVRT